MKFDFAMEIKGLKKTTNEGATNVFEGGHMNFSCEAEVSEIVQIMRDRQISMDKLLQFVKVDLPKSIRDCGHAILDIEKANRQLNQEMPSRSRRKIMEENRVLQEKYTSLEKKYEYLKKRYMEENGEEYIEPKSNKIF